MRGIFTGCINVMMILEWSWRIYGNYYFRSESRPIRQRHLYFWSIGWHYNGVVLVRCACMMRCVFFYIWELHRPFIRFAAQNANTSNWWWKLTKRPEVEVVCIMQVVVEYAMIWAYLKLLESSANETHCLSHESYPCNFILYVIVQNISIGYKRWTWKEVFSPVWSGNFILRSSRSNGFGAWFFFEGRSMKRPTGSLINIGWRFYKLQLYHSSFHRYYLCVRSMTTHK